MSSDALVSALAEIERHVAHAGWDSPARLFALVPTADLLAAEPALADQLAPPATPDALSCVEQDGFHAGDDIVDALARLAWPPTVAGVALALERLFLPAGLEADLPDDPDAAAAAVAAHPGRRDIRVVVGVTRDGARHGLARLKDHPDDLLAAPDLVPGLADALAQTLHD